MSACAHITVGAEHVTLRGVQPGPAIRWLEGSAACTTPDCGEDLIHGTIVPARWGSGMTLKCRRCGERWPIERGDPLEAVR